MLACGLDIRDGVIFKDLFYWRRPNIIYGNVTVAKVSLGSYSYINFGSSLRNVSVGNYTSIASDVTLGVLRHPTNFVSTHSQCFMPVEFFTKYSSYGILEKQLQTDSVEKEPLFDSEPKHLYIGNDVWIGANVFCPANHEIHIGDGAIVAANAVITKDVPAYSIVGGNPAKLIRKRFSLEICAELASTKWWNYDLNLCMSENPEFLHSCHINNPEKFLNWWHQGGKEILTRFPIPEIWFYFKNEQGKFIIDAQNIQPIFDN